MKNKIKKNCLEEFEELIESPIYVKLISKMPFLKRINEKRNYQRVISKKEAQILE